MMTTKYIIQMKMPHSPDLDYFYCGEGKSGAQVFELKQSKAKRYDTMEEVSRDAFILQVAHKASGEIYTVLPIRCRA